MVDEADLDLARAIAASTAALPEKNLTSFAFRASSQSRVRSSPARSRIALTNAWNDAFVGGRPILPLQRGFV